MPNISDIYLYNETTKKNENIVFWSGGNSPTQKMFNLDYDTTLLRFKALYLLSDKIVAAASFYFESQISRLITSELKDVFVNGEALYFIDENIENFKEHGLLKIGKSPEKLTAYSDKEQVMLYGSELNSLGYILRRKPESISTKMKDLWIGDLYSSSDESVGRFLEYNYADKSYLTELRLKLADIALKCQADFVWEYVEPAIRAWDMKIPEGFFRYSRKRLAEIYSIATVKLLGINIDSNLGGLFEYDTDLFTKCMRSLGVGEQLYKITPNELQKLKKDDVFQEFKKFYSNLLKSVDYNFNNISYDLSALSHALNIYETGTQQKKKFISWYFKQNKQHSRYREPLSALLDIYDKIINKAYSDSSFISDAVLNISKYNGRTNNGVILPPTFLRRCDIVENNQRKTDIIVVAALDKEREAILRHIDKYRQAETNGMIYYECELESDFHKEPVRIAVVSLPGMGNENAAITAAKSIEFFNPEAVIVTGILAGLKKSDKDEKLLGDVIFAEQIVGYEPAKVTQEGTKRRFDVLRSGYHLLMAARNLPMNKWVLESKIDRPDGDRIIPKVHFGVILSGDKVVSDTNFADEIKSSWVQAIGLEMEGYGTALAAFQSLNNVEMALIKSICDWASPDKNDEWQLYAADIAAAYTVALIKNLRLKRAAEASQGRSSDNYQESTDVVIDYDKLFSGKAILELNERLNDSWEEIAIYCEIPPISYNAFKKGKEINDIVNWLRTRKKLNLFIDAVKYLKRDDITEDFFKNI
ncbi:MAG: 5'-methylthioadenosine/S-adenosylhomocysteine nucleosidase [Clostridia bacterium]|nr:5'-methylthioadenosine/S-adenosylhomocysteine nucleosidase [Clostridia bacterium]